MHLRLLAAADAPGLPDDTGWLTPAEAERAQAMQSAARRAQFLAGHWQARRLAADAFGGEAGDWHWQAGQGAPRLRHAGGRLLHVSLSHSGDWLAVAVAESPVGVDVEHPRRERDWLALAGFALAREEADAIAAAGDVTAAFHRYWTLKEAEGKRCGLGLLPGRSRSLVARPAEPALAEAWQWDLGGGLHLAMAGAPAGSPQAEGLPAGRRPTAYRYLPSGY